MIAAGQKRLARRREQRRRVKTIEPQPLIREPLKRRRLTRATERARGPKTAIVEQHDEHVRRALRRSERHDRRKRRVGILRVIRNEPDMPSLRNRQNHTRKIRRSQRSSSGVRRGHQRVADPATADRTALQAAPRRQVDANDRPHRGKAAASSAARSPATDLTRNAPDKKANHLVDPARPWTRARGAGAVLRDLRQELAGMPCGSTRPSAVTERGSVRSSVFQLSVERRFARHGGGA